MVLLKHLSSALFANKINNFNKTHKHRFSSDEEDVSESEEEESEVDDDAGVEEESEVDDDAGEEEESEDNDDAEEGETEQTVRRTGKTNAAKRKTEEETNTIERKKLKVDDGSKEEKERV